MTQPPDPVAALAEALDTPAIFDDELAESEAMDIATALHDALHAAGWSLSHDSEREALVAAVKRLPLFDESDLITAMNGTVRSPRTIADHVEGYRNRVLAAIEGRP